MTRPARHASAGRGAVARLGGRMTTKDIRTAHVQVTCDVCGRTLLRGEHAETYLAGGSRRQVCELCTARAMHEGWVREGAALERGTRSFGGERRRSLLGRLRRSGRRTGRAAAPAGAVAPAGANGGRSGRHEPHRAARAAREPAARAAPGARGAHERRAAHRQRDRALQRAASTRARSRAWRARSARRSSSCGRRRSTDSLVSIVVSWELCWYRYEVDLSTAAPRCGSPGRATS